MFAKILQWLREVWSKMINTNDVKRALKVDVSISSSMASALQTWSAMYINQATWLADTHLKSMNLPAAIAGEISRAVTIEMEVNFSGSARADFLALQVPPLIEKMRQMVEYGCAKGGLVFKPYVSNGELKVDFVQADQFYPVEFDANGKLLSCIFSDQRIVGDKYYTRLEYHLMLPEGCKILNQAFKSTTADNLGSEVPLTEVAEWQDLEPESLITNITRPLFGYFRYPQANNVDPTSPLGVSCYARAVDLIEQADRQWSDLLWEFESGQRALYVDELAFAKDSKGRPILPKTRLYRTLAMGGEVGEEEMFNEWSPDLREQNIINGLEAILRKIEFNCGLAYGTLSNPQTIDKTATELKISQQRSYATISDTQKALRNALDDLFYAMDVWATLMNLAPAGTYSTTYDFDDSVVVDKEVQFTQDLRLVTSQIMGKVEFRMRNMNEDEATAKEQLAKVEKPEPPVGGGGLFGV